LFLTLSFIAVITSTTAAVTCHHGHHHYTGIGITSALLTNLNIIAASTRGSWLPTVIAAHRPGDLIEIRVCDLKGNEERLLIGRATPLSMLYGSYAKKKGLKPSQVLLSYKGVTIEQAWTANGTAKGQRFRLEDQAQLDAVKLLNIQVAEIGETAEVFFKVSETSKMQTIFLQYARRKGKGDASNLTFELDGKPIPVGATPRSINLNPTNIIRVKSTLKVKEGESDNARALKSEIQNLPIFRQNVICLRVQDGITGEERSFHTQQNTPLASLFRTYAHSKKMKASQLQFSYKDLLLEDFHTSAGLGMHDSSLIIVTAMVPISIKDVRDGSEV
jgi:hypothetical protein